MPRDIEEHYRETLEQQDHSGKALAKHEYTECTFINCDFSNCNLKDTDFIDCLFEGCNLSNAKTDNTGMKNATFTSCKLVGVHFNLCSNFLFSVSFKDCHLDYSSFHKKKLPKTIFTNCSLKEVDFEEADLSGAAFQQCDLLGARFISTVLEKADFRTAEHYSFDPEINKLKRAKFSFPAVTGLLDKYNIDIE